jgi:hypothetical protein
MFGRSTLHVPLQVAVVGVVALGVPFGPLLAVEAPNLRVSDYRGKQVIDYLVRPACSAEDNGGVSPALTTEPLQKCAFWIGDRNSAPALVAAEQPQSALQLAPPSEVTATLDDLPKSVAADDLVVTLKWRAISDNAKWLNLPSDLLSIDATHLPKLRLGGLPAGLLEVAVDSGSDRYELPRVLLEQGGWVDLGASRRLSREELCGVISGGDNELEDIGVYWTLADEPSRHANRVELFEGRFCLPALVDETVWVWADGAGWASEPMKVRTRPQYGQDLELVVSRNARLTLSWFPVELTGAQLDLYGELAVGSRHHLTLLERRAVSRGETIELPRHRPLVIIATPSGDDQVGLAPETMRLEEDSDAGENSHRVALEFVMGSELSGVVTVGDEEAIDGATVAAWLESSATDLPLRIRSVVTDHEGYYRLPGLPAGEYEVVVTKEGFLEGRQSVDLNAEAKDELDMRLAAGERVSGVVLEAASGKPVAGAHVQLIAHGSRSTMTGIDGRFAFNGVNEGPVSLKADAPGRRQAHERIRVESGVPLSIRLELSTGTLWQTRVSGFTGVPAQITLLRASEHYTAPVAADGSFILANGPDGLVGFTLIAADGSLLCTGGVDVPAGLSLVNFDIECNQSSGRKSER